MELATRTIPEFFGKPLLATGFVQTDLSLSDLSKMESCAGNKEELLAMKQVSCIFLLSLFIHVVMVTLIM